MEDRDIFQIIGEIQRAVARVEANQGNHRSYLDAVNSNVKEIRENLRTHVNDTNAHGEGTRTVVWEKIGKFVIAMSALVSGAYIIAKLVSK